MSDKVYSVGALSKSIRNNLLANNAKIRDAWIEGEISGWKPYPSGHFYFTLKDDEAQISCVLFAFCVKGCEEAFLQAMAQGAGAVNGLKVQLSGELDYTLSRGQCSFKAYRIRLSGLGDKMAQFNALKAKLEAEGLNKLDHPDLRRPFPFLPHRIGIVTSPAGAVIHDMCDVLFRRFPNLEVRLYPAKVQGEGAAASLAAGVAYFNALATDPNAEWRPDVVIIGRGGGSAEDLWCFNEEPVVYAVAGSVTPIISAVGHESDTTLCDYVADLRAGTPSIAAERAVPEKAKLTARVEELLARLLRAPMQCVEGWTQQLDYLSLKLQRAPREAFHACERRLQQAEIRLTPAMREAAQKGEMRLQRAQSRLMPTVREAVQHAETRLQRAALRLEPPLRHGVEAAEHRLERAAAKLALLNPDETLKRGYSITLDAAGHVVKTASEVRMGDVLVTRLSEGDVRSVVVSE